MAKKNVTLGVAQPYITDVREQPLPPSPGTSNPELIYKTRRREQAVGIDDLMSRNII